MQNMKMFLQSIQTCEACIEEFQDVPGFEDCVMAWERAIEAARVCIAELSLDQTCALAE